MIRSMTMRYDLLSNETGQISQTGSTGNLSYIRKVVLTPTQNPRWELLDWHSSWEPHGLTLHINLVGPVYRQTKPGQR